jgi:hypothetical protein
MLRLNLLVGEARRDAEQLGAIAPAKERRTS